MNNKLIKKFCLKINLSGDNDNYYPLYIKIIFFHPSFSWVSTRHTNDKDYPMFQSLNEFLMYPFDKGMIEDLVFSIPFSDFNDNKTEKVELSKIFVKDLERKEYLRGLHQCLEEFGNKWEGFENIDNSRKKIIVRNKFWFM